MIILTWVMLTLAGIGVVAHLVKEEEPVERVVGVLLDSCEVFLFWTLIKLLARQA